MKNRIKGVLKLTLGYAIVTMIMWSLNLITFEIGTAIFFFFIGALSYAKLEEKLTNREDNEEQTDSEKVSGGGFSTGSRTLF